MTPQAEYKFTYRGRAGSGEGWTVDFGLSVDGTPVGNNVQLRVGFGKLIGENDTPPFATLGGGAWVSVRDPLARHPDLCRRLVDQLAEKLVALQHPASWDDVEGIALTVMGPAVMRR